MKPNTVKYVLKSVIENKLLAELMNDSGKAAILVTKQDLEDLIAACRGYKLGDLLRAGNKVADDIKLGDVLTWEAHEKRVARLATELEQLLNEAFK